MPVTFVNVHHMYIWGCDFGHLGFVTSANLNLGMNSLESPNGGIIATFLGMSFGDNMNVLHFIKVKNFFFLK